MATLFKRIFTSQEVCLWQALTILKGALLRKFTICRLILKNVLKVKKY